MYAIAEVPKGDYNPYVPLHTGISTYLLFLAFYYF